MPPPLLVVPGLGAGLLAHWQGVPTAPTEPSVQVTASILTAIGIIAVGWPMAQMIERGTSPEPWKDTSRLITDGPYNYTRNPIYLGYLLLQAGIPLWWGQWLPMALVPLTFVLLDRLVVRKEETYLRDRFPDYADYEARVRRWL